MANESVTKPATPSKRHAPIPRGDGTKHCGIEACKRAYRAKGYCFFHYKKWRQGELPHGRYSTCSNAECVKAVELHGLCATHLASWRASRKGALAAAALAAKPAPVAVPAPVEAPVAQPPAA